MKKTYSLSNTEYPTREMKELFQAILMLRDEEETANFFRDLCTIAELREFANRWQIVLMLYERKPYTDIAKELNVSTSTISRVAQWLNEGSGGYQSVADRIVLQKRDKKQRGSLGKAAKQFTRDISKLRK